MVRPSESVAGHSHRLTGPPSRVVIEAVTPQVDAGRFPVKRTIGEAVVVSADIFADGHDHLAAVLRHRLVPPRQSASEVPWLEIPMAHIGNDRWTAQFTVETLGRYEYSIQAWVDRFGSWRSDLKKKIDAGQDVASDLLEGAELVLDTARPMGAREKVAVGVGAIDPVDTAAVPPVRDGHAWLLEQARKLEADSDQADRIALALSDDLGSEMARLEPRHLAVTSNPVLSVTVERQRARFGSWYEMFPRSAGPDATRSATFDEAAERLPAIAAMGFDVLYLPPIHPIGVSFRKGRNNSLATAPGDPGSPWAIGSELGGHKAVEPGLGTIQDFDRFVAKAADLGLEIALDLAYQCSPDHPYVREHPDWFRHRPDGTIKHAENPPKKYQDIYPLDFESRDWRALVDELKSIVLFWIDRGVRIFRVDNPHTKPFEFWEWLIEEVRAEYPQVIYLAEAFTRPKVMHYLAKVGFSQSYTYFTWRNTKAELTEYFTELTQTDLRQYFRPNLFTNTPDILHEYLQTGGRPAFQVRLILAATLGASYGIYSGFELAESRARPGTEEYLDSEKYQYRRWDRDRSGGIVDLVTRMNRVRRRNAALQSDWSLRFHGTDNDQLICYSKATPDLSNVILVIVNLDPLQMQHGWIQVPIAEIGIPAGDTYEVVDLLSEERYYWRGEWNYVRLEPDVRPAHILRLRTLPA